MDDTDDLGDHVQKTVLDIWFKHPHAQADTLPEGNSDPPEVHPVIFDQITVASISHEGLCTKGAAGPSSIDGHGWRRLCTSF